MLTQVARANKKKTSKNIHTLRGQNAPPLMETIQLFGNYSISIRSAVCRFFFPLLCSRDVCKIGTPIIIPHGLRSVESLAFRSTLRAEARSRHFAVLLAVPNLLHRWSSFRTLPLRLPSSLPPRVHSTCIWPNWTRSMTLTVCRCPPS